MNGRILADTNILIELLKGNKRVAEYIDEYEICISAISEIELLSNPLLKKQEIGTIRNLLSSCIIFDILNDEIKEFSSEYRRKKIIRKTPDAIIAATAKHHRLSLLTLDSDFAILKDIDVIYIT